MLLKYEMAMHVISDFLDSIKESLTDSQYKDGMELCQKLFKTEKNLYRMTFLYPYTFRAEDDMGNSIMRMGFKKRTGLIYLNEQSAKYIQEENRFSRDQGDVNSFINTDPLHCFPLESDLFEGGTIEWWEFPVVSLVLVDDSSSCDHGI
jgi:hypothetical protein